MPFQFINKPQYLTFAWIACVFLGIGSLSNLATGQEKCEESVLKKVESANRDLSGSLHSEPDNFFDPLPSQQLDGQLANDMIESLEDGPVDQAQGSTLGLVENVVEQPINQIRLSLDAQLPTPQLKQPSSASRNSFTTEKIPKNYQWTAPNDYYRNLLFEEPLLERHGISKHPGLQPVISGFKFFKSGILLPLKMAKGKHKRCDNPLGWGVPGDHCR